MHRKNIDGRHIRYTKIYTRWRKERSGDLPLNGSDILAQRYFLRKLDNISILIYD